MVIRGNTDDMAVLCTKTTTFEIKEAEISNSMLITPQLDIGEDVDDCGPQNTKVSKVLHFHSFYNFIYQYHAIQIITGFYLPSYKSIEMYDN